MRRGEQKPILDLSLIPLTIPEQRRQARMRSYPIAIEKRGSRWHVIVLGVDVGSTTTKDRAKHAAHMVGHYRLQLGDMAFSYVAGW